MILILKEVVPQTMKANIRMNRTTTGKNVLVTLHSNLWCVLLFRTIGFFKECKKHTQRSATFNNFTKKCSFLKCTMLIRFSCRANQLTGFYMVGTLVVKRLRPVTLLKKRLWQCFPVNFVKFSRTISIEHLWWLLLMTISKKTLRCHKSGNTAMEIKQECSKQLK